jgi:hypothetical protein
VLGPDLIALMVQMGVVANIQASFVPTDMEWASARLAPGVLPVSLLYSALLCSVPHYSTLFFSFLFYSNI